MTVAELIEKLKGCPDRDSVVYVKVVYRDGTSHLGDAGDLLVGFWNGGGVEITAKAW